MVVRYSHFPDMKPTLDGNLEERDGDAKPRILKTKGRRK
jgi:hypothetical protein